jgi:UDP-glucose 4-epimerase
MMKILIIGSRGFIGSHLVRHFHAKKWDVNGCDLIEDPGCCYKYHKVSVLSPDFESLFSKHQFDVCVNASGSGNVSYSMDQPVSDFEANTVIVSKLLDTIRKYQPTCRYLQISSAAVYGNPENLPVKESDPIAPLSPYGYHKWMSELLCKEYNSLYDIKIAIVRPFSVYGNGLKKQLIWEICKKIRTQNHIKLFGTGEESRDFVHINDLISCIWLIVNKSSFNYEIYNIASGSETRISEIAGFFNNHYKNGLQISFSGESRQGDPNNWKADISEITKLGYINLTKLSDGLSEYVGWFNNRNEH